MRPKRRLGRSSFLLRPERAEQSRGQACRRFDAPRLRGSRVIEACGGGPAGLHPVAVARLESGKQNATLATLVCQSAAYRVSIADLFLSGE
jgi:hypothetical protein